MRRLTTARRAWPWLLLLIGSPGVASAAAPPVRPLDVSLKMPGLSGRGQAGLVVSRGNTEADTLNAKVDLGYVTQPWRYLLHLEALYARSASVVSAERWSGLFQTDYELSDHTYAFGAARYEHDLFSGFIYQESVTVGEGYQWFRTSRDQLTTQIGLGWRQLRPEVLLKTPGGIVIGRIFGNSASSLVGVVGADYMHQFTPNTRLTDTLRLEAGGGNTSLANDLELAVSMTTHLAVNIGYAIHENTSPPTGAKNLDTLTTLNLAYSL